MTDDTSNPDDDDAVGYGKPPKQHQWKKGVSGNPKGRPKGSKNLKTELNDELEEKIMVTEGGKTKTVSKRRAVIKTQAVKALKGDPRAAKNLLDLDTRLNAQEAASEPKTDTLAPEDEAILDAYFEQRRRLDPDTEKEKPNSEEKKSNPQPSGTNAETDGPQKPSAHKSLEGKSHE